jgi:hydrogenase maturation protein HypF
MITVARRIEVSGIVQGVGFRPFVYQLASRLGLAGEVANTSRGVVIHAEGRKDAVDAFLRDLTAHPPPLSQITGISVFPETLRFLKTFEIVSSRKGSHPTALISPDISICHECLEEVFDPKNFRYRYPFTNCTNCGPRYTIIEDIPYDRPKTSMKEFTMCSRCQREYENPSNRRFHAQPNACPECGPSVSLHDREGQRIDSKDPILEAGHLLKEGFILAIKGLGGFHLCVDATRTESVRTLRKRKHREEKPFAVMSKDVEAVRTFAVLEDAEIQLLTSPQRPITLLKKKSPNPLSEDVSPRNSYFGVMLPYTPLHYLLFEYGFLALVMTSGNLSEEPIAIDNREAFTLLGSIADYFLIHNRDIYLRSDDSIVRYTSAAVRMIRRSRGFVPRPVFLKRPVQQILACGAELKNTLCLTKEDRAFISQHVGDMENPATYDFFRMTIEHMKRILDISPEIIAFDLHPDYLSTRYAEDASGNMKPVPVQHHHAHIASCMAENHIDGPVIGLAFDGTGYGSDGALWGGEVLIVDNKGFSRVGHLEYVPMPGGELAIKEPWRMGVSYLYRALGNEFMNHPVPLIRGMDVNKGLILTDMINKRVNTPNTSSLGRLFDGVASILGVRNRVRYEGQAAMELEMIVNPEKQEEFYDVEWLSDESYQIPISPLILGIVRDLEKGYPVSRISHKFHFTVIHLFTRLCVVISKRTGIRQVALSGGVFQNAFLLEGFLRALPQNGFEVFSHTQVPSNDGGISLGQALIASNI